MTKKTKIEIRRRADDYHAQLEGHPEVWGCGKTQAEALYDLLRSQADCLPVELVILP